MSSLRRCVVVLVAHVVACSSPGGGTESAGSSGGTTGSGGTATGGTSEGPGPGTLSATDGGSGGVTTTATTVTTTTTATTTDPSTTAAATTTDPSTTAMTGASSTGSGGTGGDPPPLGPDACKGYATRYWDCCKAHCGWQGNVHPMTDPLESCDKNDQGHGAMYNVPSACQMPANNSAFTCYSGAPWAVSDALAYGFAAVPANGDICGRCYQLEFDGTGHYNAQDPGSVALKGKAMIVQATNIGFDVGGGQFDILTPGGGVGLFDACSFQWGVQTSELGATYGGFMTYCQQTVGNDHQKQKECVLGRCAAVFDEANMGDLLAGCQWYVDWYQAADNPNLRYQEVACPAALVAVSGIDRGPLNDVGACMGGGGVCSQEEMDQCDCAWTNNGQNCGQDDGSCCWTACCG